MEIKIEKYKPKIHKNPDNCNDNCEKDCNMECDICRATPYETDFYYTFGGENHTYQWCEKCFEALKTEMKEIIK
jgi:hypothetical protein